MFELQDTVKLLRQENDDLKSDFAKATSRTHAVKEADAR